MSSPVPCTGDTYLAGLAARHSGADSQGFRQQAAGWRRAAQSREGGPSPLGRRCHDDSPSPAPSYRAPAPGVGDPGAPRISRMRTDTQAQRPSEMGQTTAQSGGGGEDNLGKMSRSMEGGRKGQERIPRPQLDLTVGLHGGGADADSAPRVFVPSYPQPRPRLDWVDPEGRARGGCAGAEVPVTWRAGRSGVL